MTSNVVWNAENGWHDGPEARPAVIDGRFVAMCPRVKPDDLVRCENTPGHTDKHYGHDLGGRLHRW